MAVLKYLIAGTLLATIIYFIASWNPGVLWIFVFMAAIGFLIWFAIKKSIESS